MWSNYGLEGARRLESLEDLEKSHGGMLALDEAWTLADSRRAMSAGAMAVDAVILKARKRGLDSVLVAQDFGMLDVRIRANARHLLVPEIVPGPGGLPTALLVNHYTRTLEGPSGGSKWAQTGEIMKISGDGLQRVMEAYDTNEAVTPLQRLGEQALNAVNEVAKTRGRKAKAGGINNVDALAAASLALGVDSGELLKNYDSHRFAEMLDVWFHDKRGKPVTVDAVRLTGGNNVVQFGERKHFVPHVKFGGWLAFQREEVWWAVDARRFVLRFMLDVERSSVSYGMFKSLCVPYASVVEGAETVPLDEPLQRWLAMLEAERLARKAAKKPPRRGPVGAL